MSRARRASRRQHRRAHGLASNASAGLLVLALLGVGLWSASPARGLAADGQSLGSQPAEVQHAYRAHYGVNAESIWTNRHNWAIGQADACPHVAYTGTTMASDHRSLSGETEAVQSLFRRTWGDLDDRRWVWEHDCAITPPPTPPPAEPALDTTPPKSSRDKSAPDSPPPASSPAGLEPDPTPPAPPTDAPESNPPPPATDQSAYQGFGSWAALCEAFFSYDPLVEPTGQYPSGNEYLDHPHALEQCQRSPAT